MLKGAERSGVETPPSEPPSSVLSTERSSDAILETDSVATTIEDVEVRALTFRSRLLHLTVTSSLY